MPGGGDQRIVDADDRERRERPALGAQLVELGDLFFERAAGERDAEQALLERIVAAVPSAGFFSSSPCAQESLPCSWHQMQ